MIPQIQVVTLPVEHLDALLEKAAERGARLALEGQAKTQADAKPAPTREWLNRPQAAELLGCSVRSVDNYAERGYITRYTAPNGQPRFKVEEVRRFAERKNPKR